MAKRPIPKVSKLTKPIEEMTERERKDRILEILRIAAPRFTSGEVDFEDSTVHLFVPPPRDMDPRATLSQRQFLAENGVTKIERATLDFLLAHELRAYTPIDDEERERAKKQNRAPRGRELTLHVSVEGRAPAEAENQPDADP